jgi:hypothetical protein
MTPHKFVVGLKASVVDENNSIYLTLFAETKIEKVTDPYWKGALSLFSELSDQQKTFLFQIIRQVAVDTTSNILGVLDGVNELRGVDGVFQLVSGDGQKLNGDLQALFLVEEEGAAEAHA